MLISLDNLGDLNIRYRIGRVWMSMIKLKNEVLIILFDNLFNFFMNNLKCEHYELNFIACDFFNFIIEDKEFLLNNDKIRNSIYNNLSMYSLL